LPWLRFFSTSLRERNAGAVAFHGRQAAGAVRFMVLCLFLAILSEGLGAIVVRVDVKTVLSTENGAHYGVGMWAAMDPANAELSGYQGGLSETAPRVVRYHAAEQTLNGSSRSWVDYTNRRWDAARIHRVLNQRPASAADLLINISGWPSWMDTNSDGKLDTDQKDAFATFCGDLVGLVNNTNHFGVRYWEPMNEKQDAYRTDIATLADIHRRCYTAMKAKDPTIKIVAGAWNQPWDSANIAAFCSAVRGYMDVFSCHGYASGGTEDRATIYAGADLTGGIQNLRNQLTGQSQVAIWVDEWAMFWSWNATGAHYMRESVGAVFCGLVLKQVILQGKAAALQVFNDADGTYGLWDVSGNLRPSGQLFKLLNRYGVGDVLSASSGGPSKIDTLAIRYGSQVLIVLMNRSLADQTVDIPAADITPSTRYDIGATTTQAPLGTLMGIAVPADHVVAILGSTPGPRLKIVATATNTVVLTWPAPSTGYTQEQSPLLEATNWTKVTELPVSNAGQNQVVMPITGEKRFFRLRSQ
jgi:hypothetical protein